MPGDVGTFGDAGGLVNDQIFPNFWHPSFRNQRKILVQIRMLTRYMGTMYLPALEAIASCGYNSVWDQDTRTDFPITRSLTANNNPSREVHRWPNIGGA